MVRGGAGRYLLGQIPNPALETDMNEDVFNMELRKLLKKVGVTSQREIEQAVREALDSGKLTGNETLKAKVRISIEGLDLDHEITGDISLV